MQIIRPEQMRRFEQQASEAFAQRMVVHLRAFSPPLAATLDDAQMHAAVTHGMARARQDGFTLQGPVRSYLEMVFMLGSGFSTDPTQAWARRTLDAAGTSQIDEMERATQLFEALLRYREQVNGPGDAYLLRALSRLEHFAAQPTPELPPAALAERLLQDLAGVHPQRLAWCGRHALDQLFRASLAQAAPLGLGGSARAGALACTLALAFGHQWHKDPLYPWISRTLRDPRLASAELRAQRLESRARTWLQHVNQQVAQEA